MPEYLFETTSAKTEEKLECLPEII